MSANRPPINRDILNLINDGSVFRPQPQDPRSTKAHEVERVAELGAKRTESLPQRGIGALALTVENLRQFVSRSETEQQP